MNWKLILVIFVALCVLVACGQNTQKSTTNNTTTSQAKPAKPTQTEKPNANAIAAGKRVYNTYCLTCHGQKGNMGASGAHDLTKTSLSLAETIKVITEGRGLMTPHKFLGNDKIKAVAKYIETFKVN